MAALAMSLALTVGSLTALAPLVGSAATALAVVLVLVALSPKSGSAALLAIGLGLYLWPVSSLHGDSGGVDPRAMALAFFILAALRSRALELLPGLTQNRGVRIHLFLVVAAASSVAWSAQPSESIVTAAGTAGGVVAALLIATVLLKTGRANKAARLVAASGVAVNAVSWVFAGMMPDVFVGGRFTGIFANANGLGLFLALAIAVLAFQPWRWRTAILLAAPMLIATGSRASILAALTAVLAPSLIARAAGLGRRIVGWLAVVAFTAAGAWAVRAPVEGELPLALRINDSRTEFWAATWQRFLDAPIVGSGTGATDHLFSVNSHLLLASELGLLGLVSGLGLLAVLWNLSRQPSTPSYVVALIAAGATNSIFESWFYRGGSPYFVLFWSVMIAASASSKPDWQGSRVNAAPDSIPQIDATGRAQ